MKKCIIILLVLVSCNNYKSNQVINTDTANTQKIKISNNLNSYENIESNCKLFYDSIVKYVFGIDFLKADTNQIKQIFTESSILKINRLNKSYGDKNVVIEDYNLKAGNSYISFFKETKYFVLTDALIKTKNIKLYKGIYIGMSRDQFYKVIEIGKMKCDTILITDVDQTTSIYFIFNKNELKEINLQTVD